jgi:hypothetical protein
MFLVHRLWQCEYGNLFPSPAEDEDTTYTVPMPIVFYLKTNRETTIICLTTNNTIKARSYLSTHDNRKVCMISGFRRAADENCALLGHYAASSC